LDFRLRVVDFAPEDFEPVERFDVVREVALAVFEPLLRAEVFDGVFADERDFEPALLRVVLDFDLLELAAARLGFVFAAVRVPADFDRPRVVAVFALRDLLPVRRAAAREPLVLRVLRPRREPRPPLLSVMPMPAPLPEPAISVSSISMSDPFFRAMCVSSRTRGNAKKHRKRDRSSARGSF
jgi:hypothetical protein